MIVKKSTDRVKILPVLQLKNLTYKLSEKRTISMAKEMETVDISLMRMLMEGPEVSLKGSPTVSPTTAALWLSLPLPPKFPRSMYFLALSQAPPALDIMTAKMKPEAVAPISNPVTPLTPSTNPTKMGTTTAMRAGALISDRKSVV